MNEGYLFGEEIGSGSYSKVYKAKKKSDPDKDFSVKRIDINKVPHEWK
jgi:serine/threonine protein kinase